MRLRSPSESASFIDQKLQHRTPKALSKQTSQHSRQRDKNQNNNRLPINADGTYLSPR